MASLHTVWIIALTPALRPSRSFVWPTDAGGTGSDGSPRRDRISARCVNCSPGSGSMKEPPTSGSSTGSTASTLRSTRAITLDRESTFWLIFASHTASSNRLQITLAP